MNLKIQLLASSWVDRVVSQKMDPRTFLLMCGRPSCSLRVSIDYLCAFMAWRCSAPIQRRAWRPLSRTYARFAEINNEAMRLTPWVSDRRPSRHQSFYLCLFVVVLWGIMCVGGGGGGGTPRAVEDYHERQGLLWRAAWWRRDGLYKCVSTSHRHRNCCRKHVFSIQLADAWLMIVLAAAGVALSSRRYSEDTLLRHP